jgi:hypothetical protein
MRTTKEILEGDTSRFAFKVSFQRDPDQGAGATEEETLSWGGFEIWVEGQNLGTHREDDTIVEAAHWYLLPMLEWLSTCWDYLLHEERLPLRIGGDDSWHSLQATAMPPPAFWMSKVSIAGTSSGTVGGSGTACLPAARAAYFLM